MLRPARAVLDNGAQPGVEDEDLRPPTTLDVEADGEGTAAPSAGSAVDSMTFRTTPFSSGLVIYDGAEEGDLAGPRRRRSERITFHRRRAEKDMVQLGPQPMVRVLRAHESPAEHR